MFLNYKENEEQYHLSWKSNFLGFLIIIFSSIVFNELLILHFCDLDRNIEANIKQRADNEILESYDNSFNKEYEDERTSKSGISELSFE